MIELKNISKTYSLGSNCVHALRDVSLTIPEGRLISVCGSSGSGKSTLLSILGCLDRPDEGEYLLLGENIAAADSKRRCELRGSMFGFVFQSFNLIPQMNALENVMLPLTFKGMSRDMRKKVSLAALESVGMGSRVGHRPYEMSGGQQQRTAIARAIAADPEIILADEPTGNLDRDSSDSVMRILRSLADKGKTVVIITHDMSIADSADLKLRIENGKVF